MTRLWISFFVLVFGLRSADAGESRAPLLDWWTTMSEALQTLGSAHRIVPPTAVSVRWNARKVWQGKVVGEILDVVAGDLNGNGKSEVVILTTETLFVMSRSRGLFDVRSHIALQAPPAPIRPRDAMGSIGIEPLGEETLIRVRSSERANGESFRYVDGELSSVGALDGFPVCQRAVVFASPGRNYFLGKSVTMPGDKRTFAPKLYSIRCQAGVDPSGHPVRFVSGVNVLGVLQIQCEGEKEYCESASREYSDVGVAHAVADIDNDGHPEVILSGTGIGTNDRVVVYSQEGTKARQLYERSFTNGVLAVSAGDFDGDGRLEVLGAVRKRGSDRMALWLLN